ncbi:MAG: hypothetical protein K2P81_02525 [Bacteriovoracaceae bacterium]|nr:hypothetical protein [Bacteriovoracaceae bacterium]
MGKNLTELCHQECLRLLRELPRHSHPKLILHTLKANVHALGLTQLARQIHTAEEKQIIVSELPLKQWQNEIERLHPLERSWEETLMRLAKENNKSLKLHWHGPHLNELTSLLLHVARNTIAHGEKPDLNLWVEVKQRGSMWHIQVKDDGGGFKAHERSPDLFAGRGEGLKYIQQTVKSWNGKCGVMSNPGVGLIITIDFPVTQVEKKAA